MNKKKTGQRLRLYAWLLGMNLYVSCFTFGGGYVIIPMLRKYYVEKKRLFTENELMDMAAVAQSSPGAIAVNLSGLCGYRAAGVIGTILCCIAAITPPIAILTVIESCYAAFRSNALIGAVLGGMEAGVAAIMLDFVIDLCRPILKKESFLLSALVPAAFIGSFFLQINAAVILLFSVAAVVGWGIFTRKWGSKDEPDF